MKYKYINAYNIFLAFIIILSVGAILPPILIELGLETPAKYIYLIYSMFCHQIHYRSLHLFDHQFAWCTRDTFIWLGILSAGILVKFLTVRVLKWYEVALFTIPIALDGGIQLIATMIGFAEDGEVFYASTNLTRMITGAFFGIGIGLWIFPVLKTFSISKIQPKITITKAVLSLFGLLFFVYVCLVGLWSITSGDYKPENILDSKVKLPEDKDEWLERRKNGLCPVDTTTQGFLNFKCE